MEQRSEKETGDPETELYLCALIRAALHGEKAEEKPKTVSWEAVFSLAANNSVEGISFLGLTDLLEPPPGEILEMWRNAYYTCIYRLLGFEQERRQIEQALAARGVSVLPLKGILLAEYYPQPGMRSMADNDILYGIVEEAEGGGYRICGGTAQEQKASVRRAKAILREIMEGRGYRLEWDLDEEREDNHDIYLKKPFYNFEMHRELVREDSPYYAYYQNIWKRAVRDPGDPYHFRLSSEDEYIFLLVHAYKHYEWRGTGFRFLADLYVFLEKKGSCLDRDYVDGELDKLGLKEYERGMRRLSEAVLGGGQTARPKEREMLRLFLERGTFGRGDMEGRMEFFLQKKEQETGSRLAAKWQYAMERLFLPGNLCKRDHPFFYKHRSLMPFLLVWRLCKGIFTCPGRLWKEIRMLIRSGK